jgi:hypothetical protein
MLTGKISRDSRPADTRLGQREMPFYKDYFTDRAVAIVDVLKECACALETEPAPLAIAWQLAKPRAARRQPRVDRDRHSGRDSLAFVRGERTPPEYPGSFIDWIQRGLDPAERR